MTEAATAHAAVVPEAEAAALRDGRRLDYLDSLRALAVFVVFLTHVTEIFIRVTTKQPGLNAFAYDANLGRVGVVTFFAISGFLIPSSLRGATAPGLTRFAITRFCRLYPAFILSILPSAATYGLMSQGLHLTQSEFLYNLTMVPRLFGEPMVNGAYWTLEVEVTFYAVCSFLFAGGVLRSGFVLACLMSVGFFMFLSSQQPIWGGLLNVPLSGDAYFFYLNIACMFWGAVIRRWWDGDRLNLVTKALMAAFSYYWLLHMPAVLLLNTLGVLHRSLDVRLIAGYSIGLGLFVAFVLVVKVRWRPVVWFGRISYSFYLLHQAGLYLVYWAVLRSPGLQHRSMVYYVIACLISSTAMAAASFAIVERPSIRLGKRLWAALDRRWVRTGGPGMWVRP